MDNRKNQREGASSSPRSRNENGGEDVTKCVSKPPAGSTSRAGSPSAGRSSSPVPSSHEASKTGKVSPTSSSGAEQLEHRQQHARYDRPRNSSTSGDEESRRPSEPAETNGRRNSTMSSSGSLASGVGKEMKRGGGGDGDGEDAKDAEHFKMVAARFRALMDRRERRLEEAMSDPQTRTDLEAMFPAVLDGDYQTLLAGVRGMEEEDFQNLLSAARKRRREVRLLAIVRDSSVIASRAVAGVLFFTAVHFSFFCDINIPLLTAVFTPGSVYE